MHCDVLGFPRLSCCSIGIEVSIIICNIQLKHLHVHRLHFLQIIIVKVLCMHNCVTMHFLPCDFNVHNYTDAWSHTLCMHVTILYRLEIKITIIINLPALLLKWNDTVN